MISCSTRFQMRTVVTRPSGPDPLLGRTAGPGPSESAHPPAVLVLSELIPSRLWISASRGSFPATVSALSDSEPNPRFPIPGRLSELAAAHQRRRGPDRGLGAPAPDALSEPIPAALPERGPIRPRRSGAAGRDGPRLGGDRPAPMAQFTVRPSRPFALSQCWTGPATRAATVTGKNRTATARPQPRRSPAHPPRGCLRRPSQESVRVRDPAQESAPPSHWQGLGSGPEGRAGSGGKAAPGPASLTRKSADGRAPPSPSPALFLSR